MFDSGSVTDTASPSEPDDAPDTGDEDNRPDFDFLALAPQSAGQNNAILDVRDIDSDGILDLITIANGGVLSWMQGDGAGAFYDQGSAWSSDLNAMMALAYSDLENNSIVVNDARTERHQFGDWNGDGQLDLLLSISATNNAQPVYAVGIVESFFTFSDWHPMQVSDTPLEIVIPASDGGFSFVIFNAPEVLFWDGTVLRPFPYTSPYAVQGSAVHLDFNEDDTKDWAIISDDGSGFKDYAIFFTLSDGTLEIGPTAVPPDGQRLEHDLDEHWVPTLDGVYGLDQSQAWEVVLRYEIPVGYTLIGHYDSDAHLDILHEHIQNGVEAFSGLGGFEMNQVTTNAPLPQPGMISADLNNSGTDDILWLQPSNDGTQLSIWVNQR